MSNFKLKQYHTSEAQIKKVITDYLTILAGQGECLWIRNNSLAGKMITADGRETYVRNGQLGSPDLIVWVKGDCYQLEVKSAVGVLSEAQERWQEQCANLGLKYYIVKNLDDVIKLLQGI